MDCQTVEANRSAASEPLIVTVVRRLVRGIGSRIPQLDLEATPNRIKRDLGFLDGRDPRYEEERLR